MYRIYLLNIQGGYIDIDLEAREKELGSETYNLKELEKCFEDWFKGYSGPDIAKWKENLWLNRKAIAFVSKLDSNKPISIQ